jgi:glycerol uptake facilitator-like aquaporin
MLMGTPMWRRAVAELLGTGLLVTVVVGSGVMATTLSHDIGVQLLANSTATGLGLAVLILVFGPVSGAHFNPVVSVADWWLGRRAGHGLNVGQVGLYVAAQVVGAIGGAILANLMFGLSAVTWARHERGNAGLWLGEIVATAGLILLVFALARTGRASVAPAAVGAYIGAAYWFTSSTSFANPAVTIGRAFTDTFAGIAPVSVPGFVMAQVVGLLVGVALLVVLYPYAGEAADDVLVPHEVSQDLSQCPAPPQVQRSQERHAPLHDSRERTSRDA